MTVPFKKKTIGNKLKGKRTYLQNRSWVTDVENKTAVIWGKEEGGINWEIGIDIHSTIYRKDNKNLLNSTGNSIQYSVMTYMGKECKKEWKKKLKEWVSLVATG